MALTAKEIIKDSSKFSAVNILSKVIQFPIAILVANVLGPTKLGILAYAALFITYAGFINVSAMSAAYRKMPGFIKSGRLKHATAIQNYAVTVDSLIIIIVFLGLLVISFLQKDIVLRNILLLLSIGYVFARFYGFLGTINFAFLDFPLAVRGKLLYTFCNPVFTLGLIFLLGIYAPPVVAILLSIVVSVFFLRNKKYNLAFKFNKSDSFELAKVGFVLNIGTILYILFANVADRTIIAAFLSKKQLGLYVFSFSIINIMLMFLKDYARILQPKIWSFSENASTTQEGFYSLRKMAISFSIITSLLIGLSHLGFIFLTYYIAPKYISAQGFFIIMSSMIWSSVGMFPHYILISARVNKQKFVNVFWGIVLVLNILFDYIVVKLGFGLEGIAITTSSFTLILTIGLYLLSEKYFFYYKKDFVLFLKKILFPLLVVITIIFFHWFTLKYFTINLIIFILISLSLQIVLWYIIINKFYKEYINKELIINLFTSFIKYLKKYLKNIKSKLST